MTEVNLLLTFRAEKIYNTHNKSQQFPQFLCWRHHVCNFLRVSKCETSGQYFYIRFLMKQLPELTSLSARPWSSVTLLTRWS